MEFGGKNWGKKIGVQKYTLIINTGRTNGGRVAKLGKNDWAKTLLIEPKLSRRNCGAKPSVFEPS